MSQGSQTVSYILQAEFLLSVNYLSKFSVKNYLNEDLYQQAAYVNALDGL